MTLPVYLDRYENNACMRGFYDDALYTFYLFYLFIYDRVSVRKYI